MNIQFTGELLRRDMTAGADIYRRVALEYIIRMTLCDVVKFQPYVKKYTEDGK